MENRPSCLKWLWGLFFLRLIGLALDGISRVLTEDDWTVWVGYGITAGTCVCLFLLAPANESYRRASYFRAGNFGLTLLNTFVLRNSAINIAISALSFLAAYHVYTGHSHINTDPKLSKHWMQLFSWQLLIAALKMLVSAVGAALLLLLDIRITAVTDCLMTLLFAAGTVLGVIYLVYLYKTISLANTQV